MSSTMPVLSKQTLVPIGVVFGAACGIVTVVWVIATAFNKIETSIDENRKTVLSMREDLLTLRGEIWTTRDMRLWTRLFGSENPELRIPPPEK